MEADQDWSSRALRPAIKKVPVVISTTHLGGKVSVGELRTAIADDDIAANGSGSVIRAFDLNQCFDKSWAYPFYHRPDSLPRFLGPLSVTKSVALPACKGVHHVRASNTYIAAAPNYASPLLGVPIANGGPAHYRGPRGL